ncbi:MAG: aspartate aminotransferase family protein, partial [Acidimicrobiia bacterium]|nr:aspartate aminotransferase family protein [Acidimicrobiia bacterium]
MAGDGTEFEGDTNLSKRRAGFQKGMTDAATREMLEADAAAFLHQSLSTPCLDVVESAEGIYFTAASGTRYMDFHGNTVHGIGYRHPRLVEALKSQLDDLVFSPRRYTNEVAVALAEKLAEVTPGDLSKSLLVPGGSEAIEVALRIARGATGRFKTISFWGAFHGAGFGASSVGGEALFRSGPAGPLLPGTNHVPPVYCYRCPYGHPSDGDCCMMAAETIRYVLEAERDVAAVVAEPIRSVPLVPPDDFWKEVRAACDEYGALLIFDEIAAGLGKTGKMWSSQHYDTVPDIMVTGKGLGGGVVPLAAVCARPELDVLGEVSIGHYTHEKNPFLARAGLTVLEIIETEGLVANAAEVGAHGISLARQLHDRHELVGDVRGKGLLIGIELVTGRDTKEPAHDAADALLYGCLERGL